MKTKIKLIALLLSVAFLVEACGNKSAYQTPRKGKHGGKHRIRTEMGGYL